MARCGGRSEPVSKKRRCLQPVENCKQQCRGGVHLPKVSLAYIPSLRTMENPASFSSTQGKKEHHPSGWCSFFAMQKCSKIRNVPFPRPCGATGNDARKLHAHFVCGMRCPYAADLMGKQEGTAAVKVAPGILHRYFSPICV